jgi:hypothetical protein
MVLLQDVNIPSLKEEGNYGTSQRARDLGGFIWLKTG